MARKLFVENRLLLFNFVIIVAFLAQVSGRKHTLKLQDESRRLVRLNSFGFDQHGYLAVKLSDMILPLRNNHTYGFTLDKSLRSTSEILPVWDDKTTLCPLLKVNDTDTSVVSFLVEFLGSDQIRLRINRNGDLKNLTITNEDGIMDNSTEVSRGKRSARQLPLSPTPRQKRAAAEDSSNASSTNQTKTGGAGWTSPPRPAESVNFIPGAVSSKSAARNVYEVHFVIYIMDAKEVGLYSLAFHNCRPDNVINLTVEMKENNNGNYLSVGQMPLPLMYFIFSVLYFAVGSLWFYVICSSKEGVFKIHYLMLALMYIKSMSLLCHGVNFHFIEAKGQQEEAFAILFYIVYLMRGIFMFATIVLIGAGWTFVKHILSDRDKKIFVIVIPLQILTNVAGIILSESEEGQSSYTMWKDLFILVDLLCCGAILFPVVWSIRHLQQASQTDGKAAVNLEKLKIFRHFYILVVCYIYFTRIIVLLLSITVPFRFEWLGECFVEIATLAFFMLTGYKFRPASNNPYLQVPQSDDETEMEVVTQSGALEGVTRVNVKSKNKREEESTEPLLKQRENSHEYD